MMKKKTFEELVRELEEHPERGDEIKEEMMKTSEVQKIVAEDYVSPIVQAASTYTAYKNKEELYSFEGIKAVLGAQKDALHSNDLNGLENMLLAQAYTLDMLFQKEARRAIRQDYINQYKIHLDIALKAQRQCRATLQTLAEIKNPRPYIQNNQAQYQQVNNNVPEQLSREKKVKSSNGLLENKRDETEWLDTGAPETTSGNDKKLETVEK